MFRVSVDPARRRRSRLPREALGTRVSRNPVIDCGHYVPQRWAGGPRWAGTGTANVAQPMQKKISDLVARAARTPLFGPAVIAALGAIVIGGRSFATDEAFTRGSLRVQHTVFRAR